MKGSDFSSRQEFWKKTISEQKTSGLSINNFCQGHGITSSAFHYWVRRLEKSDFIPISTKKSDGFRLVFNGTTLEFEKRPDPGWLRELLKGGP